MITALFLAVFACTLAVGGWLIIRVDVHRPLPKLSAPRDPGAAENGPRVVTPLGARATSEPPAPADETAQMSQHPGAGPALQ